MRRLAAILSLSGVALSASLAPAQDVAYEKYSLPNGMTVILHEDHSLPVVAVNTWYHVGAKDEPPGRSGFAHLFEHLMFMGTRRVAGNQFDVLMETGGGSNNATTSFDRTNYFSSGPASLLPTLLWLDADRLEDLGRTMTQEKLDLQRDVVRNERRQSIENQPYGKAELLITEIMFPVGHPYHNEVIGTHADLEAATVQDVKDFFATFYVPNNASLVVAGDFKSSEVKPLIDSLFGTIKRGAEPAHKSVPPVALTGVQRAITTDKVQLAKVAIAYHSPASFAQGDAECELIGAILSQGKTSRLYKRLVTDENLAVQVTAGQSAALLQSTFRIDAIAAPGADLARIEAVIDEEVARFLASGPTPEELDRQQTAVELGKVGGLQSLLAKADKLNEYEYFFSEPNGFKRDLNRYRAATPASIKEWAGKVLTKDARLIVHIQPDLSRPVASGRDQRPDNYASAVFSPPAPETFTLPGGVPVMLWHRPELPLISMRMVFVPGDVLDAPAQSGRSALTAQMLFEGAGGMSAEAFSDAMQDLGANFDADASVQSASVSLSSLSRNFAKSLDLTVKALRSPNMLDADWERVKRLHVEALRRVNDQPTLVAARVGQRLLYGDASPIAWPDSGTINTVQSLTLNHIKEQQKSLFSADNATILIAGDLTRSDAEKLLSSHLGDWKVGKRAAPASKTYATKAPATPGMRLVIVNRTGSEQTVVRFMTPGVTMHDPKRIQLDLINTILGGSFTSRLNQNLREKNGYTYGAGSDCVTLPSAGYFMARSSVKADVTGPSIHEFLAEFSRLASGDISDDEVAKARETLRTNAVQAFEGVGGVVSTAAGLVESNLPFTTLASDMAAMQNVKATDLNPLAKNAINLSSGVLVLVGDQDLILEQIKDLPLPKPEFFDADATPVSSPN